MINDTKHLFLATLSWKLRYVASPGIVASPKSWGEVKKIWGSKMFDFRRI